MDKAQIASMDFILSAVIFFILIAGVMSFWNIYILRFDANLEQKELVLKAAKITDLFVENEGSPTGWNETDVAVIGLVSSDRKIDNDKLASFLNLSYDQVKSYLNIDENEFYFRVVDLNGAVVKAKGNFAEKGLPPGDVDSIIKIRRIAMYGSQRAVVEFSLWE
ncbi:MAG: hypothetical protein AABX08_02645 [Nanoarchaeota archaeon]